MAGEDAPEVLVDSAVTICLIGAAEGCRTPAALNMGESQSVCQCVQSVLSCAVLAVLRWPAHGHLLNPL